MKTIISNKELAFLVETAIKSDVSKEDFKVFVQSKKLEREIKVCVNNKFKSLLK
ncbi:hypothetical protein [Bacillus sp. V2I10]|uniref:hypothetical protein n=1 Tax=Bacillus sp. V2I10 TaxID=3042276 RepID=UPI00277D5384|nr:hypothetical protein [Bacillus sp. V2I10]MDQ0859437.1 hypothetical protein [Bacillus sp. V2I10]